MWICMHRTWSEEKLIADRQVWALTSTGTFRRDKINFQVFQLVLRLKPKSLLTNNGALKFWITLIILSNMGKFNFLNIAFLCAFDFKLHNFNSCNLKHCLEMLIPVLMGDIHHCCVIFIPVTQTHSWVYLPEGIYYGCGEEQRMPPPICHIGILVILN